MELWIILLIVVVAATTQSAIGFGLAVVFTPLATLVVGAQEAIATSMLLAVVLSVATYAEHRPRASLRDIAPLGLAAVAATPLGILALTRFDETSLRVLVGAAVLVGAVSTLTRGAPSERAERLPVTIAVGLVGGVARGATSMGGPAVVLYQHWLGRPADAIRGNMFAYFAFLSVLSLPVVWFGGVITDDVVRNLLAALPALATGLLAGRWLRGRLPERWFRRITLALLAGTSVAAFGGALASAL